MLRFIKGPATVAVLVAVLGAATLMAIPVPPQPIPVSRLIASLSERIEKNPDDIQALFTLGRVHYFAFAGSTDTLNVRNRESAAPDLYDFWTARGSEVRANTTRPLTEAERVSHLRNALTYLNRAATLKKRSAEEDGRYELTLACALEEGSPFAATIGPIGGLPPDRTGWIEEAIRFYELAFDRSVVADSRIKSRPLWGLQQLVSYEAGLSYQRLIQSLGRAPSAAERKRLAQIDRTLATMKQLPPGPVTPLIFAMDRSATLPDLLSTRVVSFDLDGSKRPQRYAWVKRETAILVWDPGNSGRITSGRQLFGSVTWWMFWDDAFQALRVLDDDGNRWIDGGELAGLAVWLDRDEDGVSDTGEVIPIEDTPIAAIATNATGRTGRALMNVSGLRLKDGRLLPTYDWVAKPTTLNGT